MLSTSPKTPASSGSVSGVGSIIVDTTMPEGVINGFSADGVLIVSVRYMPNVERLVGTEADEKRCVSWRASRADARRIAYIAAWNSQPGLPCDGCA